MNTYGAQVVWSRGKDESFLDNRYSRKHVLRFDGGVDVVGSSSPHAVPLPYSALAAVDPQEAFVAALASSHMLWFLLLASRAGFVVDRYEDDALGVLAETASGRFAMTVVTLRPLVRFSGERRPTRMQAEALHQRAHAECFIANAVKSDVRCEPVWID